MANHAQSKKRIRQNVRRAAFNGSRRSRVRGLIKTVEASISAGTKDAARDVFQIVQPELARCGQIGIMHRNTVSRTLSRLNKRIMSL